MTETRVPLIPGAETPEGQERIRKAVEARNDVDFRAFMMLQRLVDESMVHACALRAALISLGDEEVEARELANEVAAEIREIIRDRSNANNEVLAALAGRPA